MRKDLSFMNSTMTTQRKEDKGIRALIINEKW